MRVEAGKRYRLVSTASEGVDREGIAEVSPAGYFMVCGQWVTTDGHVPGTGYLLAEVPSMVTVQLPRMQQDGGHIHSFIAEKEWYLSVHPFAHIEPSQTPTDAAEPPAPVKTPEPLSAAVPDDPRPYWHDEHRDLDHFRRVFASWDFRSGT